MSTSGHQQKPLLNLCMISDGKPGHYHQSLGVIRALKNHYSVQLTTLELRLPLGLMRWFLKAAVNHFPTLLTPLIWLAYGRIQIATSPQMLISCGGKTLYANVWLARKTGAVNAFMGSLRGVKPQHFSVIISGLAMPEVSNLIELELSPGAVGDSDLQQQAAKFLAQLHTETSTTCNQPLWALLMGGDGAGYRFNETDIEQLIQLMITAAQQQGIQWLLTTSRRTPLAQEQQLQAAAEQYPQYFAHCVFYRQRAQKIMAAYLGAAKMVFASIDSASMLSEAIMSKRPVIALEPAQASPNENYQQFLHKHKQKKRLMVLPLASAVAQLPTINAENFQPLAQSIDQQIVDGLRPYLNNKELS